MLNYFILQALEGFVPRHVMDVDVGPAWITAQHAQPCRGLLATARREADRICDELEAQCHELGALEDDGLSGRVRYLTSIAILAAAYTSARQDLGRDRLTYLRTLHSVAEEWRAGATIELSNALVSLTFPAGQSNPGQAMGMWIWLNLGIADAGIHLRWVGSTMRFIHAYGESVQGAAQSLAAVLPDDGDSGDSV